MEWVEGRVRCTRCTRYQYPWHPWAGCTRYQYRLVVSYGGLVGGSLLGGAWCVSAASRRGREGECSGLGRGDAVGWRCPLGKKMYAIKERYKYRLEGS